MMTRKALELSECLHEQGMRDNNPLARQLPHSNTARITSTECFHNLSKVSFGSNHIDHNLVDIFIKNSL